jgi:hypothetical protein
MTQFAEGPQAARLRQRYDEMRRDGVIDFKFTPRPDVSDCTLEEVCRSLNEALDAVDRGDTEEMLPLGDGRRSKQ